jgi:hypothetical protein
MTDANKASGEKVKKSGIYKARHKDEHVEDHEVTCMSGRTFPICLECGDSVRFALVRHAPNVDRHEQFKGHVVAP